MKEEARKNPKGLKSNETDRSNKNNDIKSQREKPQTVYILRDSMVRKLNGYLLRRHTASFQCTMSPDVVSTLERRCVSTGSNKKGKT